MDGISRAEIELGFFQTHGEGAAGELLAVYPGRKRKAVWYLGQPLRPQYPSDESHHQRLRENGQAGRYPH